MDRVKSGDWSFEILDVCYTPYWKVEKCCFHDNRQYAINQSVNRNQTNMNGEQQQQQRKAPSISEYKLSKQIGNVRLCIIGCKYTYDQRNQKKKKKLALIMIC